MKGFLSEYLQSLEPDVEFSEEEMQKFGEYLSQFDDMAKELVAKLEADRRDALCEKEEARGFKVATEQVLEEACKVLREEKARAEEFKAFVVRWCWVFVVLLLLNAVVCGGYLVERFFP